MSERAEQERGKAHAARVRDQKIVKGPLLTLDAASRRDLPAGGALAAERALPAEQVGGGEAVRRFLGAGQAQADEGQNDSSAARVSARRPNRTGLPDELKSAVEALSGFSLDGVQVHYNSPQPRRFRALAYTQGQHIFVAPGQERHLPHEAWHVIQQAQGRVRPMFQLPDGARLNIDEQLESEADHMGERAGWQAGPGAPAASIQLKSSQAAHLPASIQLKLTQQDARALREYFFEHYNDLISWQKWRPYHDNIAEVNDDLHEAQDDVDRQIAELNLPTTAGAARDSLLASSPGSLVIIGGQRRTLAGTYWYMIGWGLMNYSLHVHVNERGTINQGEHKIRSKDFKQEIYVPQASLNGPLYQKIKELNPFQERK